MRLMDVEMFLYLRPGGRLFFRGRDGYGYVNLGKRDKGHKYWLFSRLTYGLGYRGYWWGGELFPVLGN